MSFSFAAVGTKDQVVAQLRAQDLSTSGQLAQDVRELLASALEDDSVKTLAGYHYAYIVKAQGHSGVGSPLSLSLTVEAQWVPDVVSQDTPEHVTA